MSYTNTVRYFPAGIGAAGHLGAIDVSDSSDTTEFTWIAKHNCKIYGFGGVVTEAMGTMSSTSAVGSLVIGSTEHSTMTATPSAAIGTESEGTDFDPVYVAAGTSIIFKNKTQASGGTTVGEWAGYVYLEMFPDLTPA